MRVMDMFNNKKTQLSTSSASASFVNLILGWRWLDLALRLERRGLV